MASRNRLRQLVSQTLNTQFREWGLPLDIDYKTYTQLVDKPVTPHMVQKSFYNWRTAVHSVRLTGYTPPVLEPVAPVKPASQEAKPVVSDALAALAAKTTVKED